MPQDKHAQTSGIVIHWSRAYDVAFGWFLRTSDAEILARAGVGPGDRVLDVGTGPGYLALAAEKLVAPDGVAVGIDASPEMIDRALTLAARRGSRAEYRVAAAESLPFDDASFDVVVSRLVFHHLSGDVKTQALGEMARVLRTGGRLPIVDMASAAARGAHFLVAHALGTHSEAGADLPVLVHAAGFEQLTTGGLMHGMLAGVLAVNPERNAQE
jgi:demethylmenaquinone methyltransferase/2-methoxy-6-polyprenyl-1,4-benzoquinol methylase/phosphoethanolamine N-methyltransferase